MSVLGSPEKGRWVIPDFRHVYTDIGGGADLDLAIRRGKQVAET
jgi:hypothetical protein